MKYLYLLFIAYVIVISGCLSDDPDCMIDCSEDDLPEITMEGKNTFGCLVDGRVWTPQGGGIGVDNPDAFLDQMDDFVGVSVKNESDVNSLTNMSISFCGLMNQTSYCDLLRLAYDPSCGIFVLDTSIPHLFQINRLDEEELIFSGEFFFDAISEDCQDTIQVRNGRFDLKLRKL